MRNEPNLRLDPYRLAQPPSEPGRNWGAFRIGQLRVISSGTPDPDDPNVDQWEHVSVSKLDSITPPTWDEMCFIKRKFWRDDETVIQFHPTQSEYVNLHPGVLHLWRKVGCNHELPPRHLI